MRLEPFGIRLRQLLVLVAVVALLLGQFARESRAKRRVEDLKRRHIAARQELNALKAQEALFGHLGLAILAHPDRCERLSFDRKGGATPDGRAVPEPAARRIADRLLDPRHYGVINSDDPEPQAGLRFNRGADSVDILYEQGANYLNVWAQVHAAGVADPPRFGPRCWDDAGLAQLLRGLGP